MKNLLTSLLLLACLSAGSTPFSLAYVGDIHVAGGRCLTNELTSFQSYVWSHTNDGDANISAVLSAGDLYEQSVSPTQVLSGAFVNGVTLFNAMSNFISGGIFTLASNGNHDADETNTNLPPYSSGSVSGLPGNDWNSWLPVSFWQQNTNTTKSRYVGTMNANDSKAIAFLYTNQVPFIFITIPWATNLLSSAVNNGNASTVIPAAYQQSVAWASNLLAQYPDHLGVLMTHYMIDVNYNLTYNDTGQDLYTNIGLSQALFDNMNPMPNNLFLVLSGHNRFLYKGHRVFQTPNGNFGCIHQFNVQFFTNSVENVALITIDPAVGMVKFRTWDCYSSSYKTNGETYVQGLANQHFSIIHNWTMPLPNLVRAFNLLNIFQF